MAFDETMIENINICGKDIYIFESHHYALYCWALAKRKHSEADVSLFSFDYHTDTMEPFRRFTIKQKQQNLFDEVRNALVASIDYTNDNSVKEAVVKLHNDEHIKTAIACGIIKQAFIIAHMGSECPKSFEETERLKKLNSDESIRQIISGTYRVTPLKNRTYPPSDIYMPDFFMGFDDGDKVADKLLEDEFLLPYFRMLARMSSLISEDAILNKPYILDIDLDYFTTGQAVHPNNAELLGNLVRNAAIITIAKESECVNLCSKGRTDAGYLLSNLLKLIGKYLL